MQGILLVHRRQGRSRWHRGEKVDIGECFKLTGNNLVAGAIFGVVLGILVVVLQPASASLVFLFLGFVPVLSALDDKGADALGESVNLSTSRRQRGHGLPGSSAGSLAAVLCSSAPRSRMIGGTYLVKRYRGEPVAA